MLDRRDIRETVDYIALGLFAYVLIDELSKAQEHPESIPEKTKAIQLAINSLKSISKKEEYPSSTLVFQTYQEFSVLSANLKKRKMDITTLTDDLTKILYKETEKEERHKKAVFLIEFFKQISTDAITETGAPEEEIPFGVRQLAANYNQHQ